MSDAAGLHTFLLAGRNPDGGWGYRRGNASRLEPTCCAVLALAGALDRGSVHDTLAKWPVRDGLLLERAGGEPNYGFHALGMLALGASRVEHRAGNTTLLTAFQRAGGLRLPQSNINLQNNQLEGWSWIADTFSWVEPTAWGVLALKRARTLAWGGLDPARLKESEAVLFDRVCDLGGWNYGNSNMLGRELHAYVPNTAIALLALQDHRDDPAVRRSVVFLERQATWECSSYALALALMALRAYGADTGVVTEALQRQVLNTCDLGQQLGVALALYALGDDDAAFRI